MIGVDMARRVTGWTEFVSFMKGAWVGSPPVVLVVCFIMRQGRGNEATEVVFCL